jgi:RNA polymerase sigma-70 factor (ECF subfamily)
MGSGFLGAIGLDREVREVKKKAVRPSNEESDLHDEEIARGIGNGDPRAFDVFFERYAAPLLGYLRGMIGERAAAEDLLQETMLRIHRNIGRYRERGAFRAWVYRIATNLALTELRRARFQAGAQDELASRMNDPPEPAADERLERNETLGAVRAGIAALPDEQRAVVLLRVRRGMAIREIARALCIPEGTVKSRLHYAVRNLRASLFESDSPRNSEETSRHAMRRREERPV